MVNYNNSYIYKICCKDTEIKDIYIGSTTNFTHRKYEHKYNSFNENSKKYNMKLYKFIRDNGGWENWDMILIEKVSCDCKLELHKIEREFIEKYNSSLNFQIPTRTYKEWKEKYYENNKNKINEYSKKYYKNNKDKIKEYNKKYYEDNKKKINFQKNKDNLKIICGCGYTINKDHYKRHCQRKHHIKYINEQNKKIQSI